MNGGHPHALPTPLGRVAVPGSKPAAFSFAMIENTAAGRRGMDQRPVTTGTEARAGSKEGVVRYVLLASLVLVVVLFIVAYNLVS